MMPSSRIGGLTPQQQQMQQQQQQQQQRQMMMGQQMGRCRMAGHAAGYATGMQQQQHMGGYGMQQACSSCSRWEGTNGGACCKVCSSRSWARVEASGGYLLVAGSCSRRLRSSPNTTPHSISSDFNLVMMMNVLQVARFASRDHALAAAAFAARSLAARARCASSSASRLASSSASAIARRSSSSASHSSI